MKHCGQFLMKRAWPLSGQRIVWLLVPLLLGLSVSSSWAHRLDVAYAFDGDAILIEAWFAGEDPVANGEVTITAEDGTVLVQGETNDSGFFRWQPSEAQTVEVEIYGGRGHQQTIRIPASEIALLLENAASAPQATAPQATGGQPEAAPTPAGVSERIESATPPAARSSNTTAPGSLRTVQGSTVGQFGMPERITMGLIFILAAVAAWLSWQNARRLQSLEELLRKQNQ